MDVMTLDQVVASNFRGGVKDAGPDDEQFIRWTKPLLIESMTADRFRNRTGERRSRHQKRWK